jgi:hypothetical protein
MTMDNRGDRMVVKDMREIMSWDDLLRACRDIALVEAHCQMRDGDPVAAAQHAARLRRLSQRLNDTFQWWKDASVD